MHERKVLLVNLVISVGNDERFLVWIGPGGPRCPRIALPEGADRLGSRIESAALATLGLNVAYGEVLSFHVSSDAPDVYALVSARRPVNPMPGAAMLRLSELIEVGTDPALVRLFQAASRRMSAEQFAVTIGGAVQRALAKSVEYLEETFTVEDGRCGWSQCLSNDAVGVLSSAQGLLALAHTKVGSRYIDPTATCLEDAQNDDGGWQVKHSLMGAPNDISITESTCYCMWALLEAGRAADSFSVASGAGWLLDTQRESGGWGASERTKETEVIATAFAVRILAQLGYRQAVTKGVNWLRLTQFKDGGWGYLRRDDDSSAAPTAHAVISLLEAGALPDDPVIGSACDYLRAKFNHSDAEPWQSTIFDTLVDPGTGSRLNFRNYATPWALIALHRAGANLSDQYLQKGIARLLRRQGYDGAWRCNGTVPSGRTVWAAHDAIYALKTVVSIDVASNLAIDARRAAAESLQAAVIQTLESWLGAS